MLTTALILGAIASLADIAGGLVLVRARGVERYLRYFVALGAGFLMATARDRDGAREPEDESALGPGADHGRLLRRPSA